MRNPLFALSLFLLSAFAALAPAQTSGGAASTPSAAPAQGQHRPSTTGGVKVKAGESHTNGDDLTVSTNKGSKGKATVYPKDGDHRSQSTVNTSTGWAGEISGLDGNDTVNLGSSSDATISGDGGAVVMGSGSATITNDGKPGGPPIHVTRADGSTHDVDPGDTETF